MKAYLLHALQLNGKHFDASTDQKPSIVDLDDGEFSRLSAMMAVRAPTDHEVKLHRLLVGNAVEDAEVVEETPAPQHRGKAVSAPAAAENAAPTNEETPAPQHRGKAVSAPAAAENAAPTNEEI